MKIAPFFLSQSKSLQHSMLERKYPHPTCIQSRYNLWRFSFPNHHTTDRRRKIITSSHRVWNQLNWASSNSPTTFLAACKLAHKVLFSTPGFLVRNTTPFSSAASLTGHLCTTHSHFGNDHLSAGRLAAWSRKGDNFYYTTHDFVPR